MIGIRHEEQPVACITFSPLAVPLTKFTKSVFVPESNLNTSRGSCRRSRDEFPSTNLNESEIIWGFSLRFAIVRTKRHLDTAIDMRTKIQKLAGKTLKRPISKWFLDNTWKIDENLVQIDRRSYSGCDRMIPIRSPRIGTDHDFMDCGFDSGSLNITGLKCWQILVYFEYHNPKNNSQVFRIRDNRNRPTVFLHKA
jgi:hypothetical protein